MPQPRLYGTSESKVWLDNRESRRPSWLFSLSLAFRMGDSKPLSALESGTTSPRKRACSSDICGNMTEGNFGGGEFVM